MRKIIQYIDTLIKQEAKPTADGYSLDIEDIDEIDQESLAALYLQHDNLSLDCIMNDTVAEAVISHLTTDQCNNYDLSEIIRKSAVSYYEKHIRSLLAERLENYEQDQIYNEGFTKWRDRQTGEIHWSTL